MRRILLVAAALALLFALVPGAAAADAVTPRTTAADPTSLTFVTPSAIVAGVPTTLVVTLRDTATASPVSGANVSFTQRTTFGWLALGNGTTGSQGDAGVTYEPVSNGTYTILVAYAGNASYGPANTTLTLTVLGVSTPPPPILTGDRLIVLVIVAVVGGVWATYGFVAYLVLGIRTVGSMSEEESESMEKEIMEKEASAAEEPKKRVPGASNANRAVVYLAVSALVLSGAAVVLLLSGGIAHTSAYTPTTVSLQVTVIPDFRGTGWDSFVPDELVVHAGDTVKLTLYNEDTGMAHGFAIDALGVNVQLPAATTDAGGNITPYSTTVTFTVPSAGAFTWYCTDPCGPGHTTMTGTLMVLPDD